MHFRGTLAQLKELVSSCGLTGTWMDSVGNGHSQFRTLNGGVLNWWPSSGTLSMQGTPQAKTALEATLGAVLDESAGASATPTHPIQQRIFVVHGHDVTAREQLELVIHRLGLEPFVLQNSSGAGLTIIEALEQQIGKEPASAFGIVLVTPDDVGYTKAGGPTEAKARARQNVILEMGMLFASLTRDRVVLLVKGFVEMPSDVTGVIYLNFNDHVKEVVPKLAERLQLAGFGLDAQRIASAMA